jgi:predicted restriction endonuclease
VSEVDCIAYWDSNTGLLYIGKPSAVANRPIGDRWKVPFDSVKTYKVTDFSFKVTTLVALLRDEVKRLGTVCTYWSKSATKKKQALSESEAAKLAKDVDDTDADEVVKNEIRREIWCRTHAHKQFRAGLMSKWKFQCALTGVKNENLLVASHIKPWAACRDEPRQQTDFDNGLLLCSPIDKLFDRGFLTFNDDGSIKLHKVGHERSLDEGSLAVFGLVAAKLPKIEQTLTTKSKEFLAYHRNHVFNRD